MKGSQLPCRKVIPAAVGIDQPWLPIQGHRHRVDREVAAAQVGLDPGGRLDHWKGAALQVALRSSGGDVDLVPVELHLRGPEPLVRDDVSTELGRQLGGVPNDDEVDVGPAALEQEVAHGAANQVDGIVGDSAHRRKLRVHALKRLGEALAGLPCHQSRTGMPSAARRSLASRTR